MWCAPMDGACPHTSQAVIETDLSDGTVHLKDTANSSSDWLLSSKCNS